MQYFWAILKAVPVLWDAWNALVGAFLGFKRESRRKAREERTAERVEIGLRLQDKGISDADKLALITRLNELSAGGKRS
jgi:hypothetical protein